VTTINKLSGRNYSYHKPEYIRKQRIAKFRKFHPDFNDEQIEQLLEKPVVTRKKYSLGYIPWNKGLTKETDIRVARNAIGISRSTKGRKSWNKQKELTPRETRMCLTCGAQFRCMVTINKVYCSRKCANRATIQIRAEQFKGIDPSSRWKNKKASYAKASETRRKGQAEGKYKYGTKEYRNLCSLLRKKMWQDNTEYGKKCLGFRKPNKEELQLNNIIEKTFPKTWKYVGNGEVIIGGKNPDWININGAKAVIEFNGEYWHKNIFEEAKQINHYKQYGFSCLVIWESELSNSKKIKSKVRRFINVTKNIS